MKREIEFAKSRGFNMMKFCLWIPPKRYLELCDEMGMLAWIEYPTWHPDFSPKHLAALKSEYDEFFEYDRLHPSVVLRSLTCETGPSADINVVRELYQQCKRRVPGAIVEDDSSWIAWNRIHDFYDDHPYGNNHTWGSTLKRLQDHIGERETKPLILGEAIAADTWTAPEPLLKRVGESRPFWLPQFLDDAQRWLNEMRPIVGDEVLERLYPDSLNYALAMRKYQIETFRRDAPDSGYVVSVIRDIPFCGMGLIDFQGTEKWPVSDWNWHGERMLCLETSNDQRSFVSDAPVTGAIHFRGQAIDSDTSVRCQLALYTPDSNQPIQTKRVSLDATALNSNPVEFDWKPISVERATRLVMRASLHDDSEGQLASNEWVFWLVPGPSLSKGTTVRMATDVDMPFPVSNDANAKLIVTHQLDANGMQHVKNGGQVLLLPNNRPGSMPLRSHWFLRGGPLVNNRQLLTSVPRQLLVELQHFDLASDVVPTIQHYLEYVEPVLVLWDNHDLKHVNTHGLIYRMGFPGGGGITVSAVDHESTAAGQFLLAELINDINEQKFPVVADSADLLTRLESESVSRTIRLDQKTWQFQVDADHTGQQQDWQSVDLDDSSWSTIGIDRHWESQGHDTLDGWAWYRVRFDLPADWPADQVYLNFTGVDDHYRAYVNGQLVGSSGDIENRQTAFDERKGYDISRWVKPGESVQVAVEVYDWYGAGGIFRPVTIDTAPVSDRPRILK